MTEKTLGLLKEAFLMGCTDEEACLYAEINPDTLYSYQKRNPKYAEQKEHWKQKPILKARQTVNSNLENISTATWYLERKKKDEFSAKQDFGGSIDVPGLQELAKSVKQILEK